ncbi:hypothetical protein ACWGIV_31015 [Streptomyces sp. NPDC054844]
MFAYAAAENVTLRIDSTETVEELVVLRHPIPEPGTVSLEDFYPDACGSHAAALLRTVCFLAGRLTRGHTANVIRAIYMVSVKV